MSYEARPLERVENAAYSLRSDAPSKVSSLSGQKRSLQAIQQRINSPWSKYQEDYALTATTRPLSVLNIVREGAEKRTHGESNSVRAAPSVPASVSPRKIVGADYNAEAVPISPCLSSYSSASQPLKPLPIRSGRTSMQGGLPRARQLPNSAVVPTVGTTTGTSNSIGIVLMHGTSDSRLKNFILPPSFEPLLERSKGATTQPQAVISQSIDRGVTDLPQNDANPDSRATVQSPCRVLLQPTGIKYVGNSATVSTSDSQLIKNSQPNRTVVGKQSRVKTVVVQELPSSADSLDPSHSIGNSRPMVPEAHGPASSENHFALPPSSRLNNLNLSEILSALEPIPGIEHRTRTGQATIASATRLFSRSNTSSQLVPTRSGDVRLDARTEGNDKESEDDGTAAMVEGAGHVYYNIAEEQEDADLIPLSRIRLIPSEDYSGAQLQNLNRDSEKDAEVPGNQTLRQTTRVKSNQSQTSRRRPPYRTRHIHSAESDAINMKPSLMQDNVRLQSDLSIARKDRRGTSKGRTSRPPLKVPALCEIAHLYGINLDADIQMPSTNQSEGRCESPNFEQPEGVQEDTGELGKETHPNADASLSGSEDASDLSPRLIGNEMSKLTGRRNSQYLSEQFRLWRNARAITRARRMSNGMLPLVPQLQVGPSFEEPPMVTAMTSRRYNESHRKELEDEIAKQKQMLTLQEQALNEQAILVLQISERKPPVPIKDSANKDARAAIEHQKNAPQKQLGPHRERRERPPEVVVPDFAAQIEAIEARKRILKLRNDAKLRFKKKGILDSNDPEGTTDKYLLDKAALQMASLDLPVHAFAPGAVGLSFPKVSGRKKVEDEEERSVAEVGPVSASESASASDEQGALEMESSRHTSPKQQDMAYDSEAHSDAYSWISKQANTLVRSSVLSIKEEFEEFDAEARKKVEKISTLAEELEFNRNSLHTRLAAQAKTSIDSEHLQTAHQVQGTVVAASTKIDKLLDDVKQDAFRRQVEDAEILAKLELKWDAERIIGGAMKAFEGGHYFPIQPRKSSASSSFNAAEALESRFRKNYLASVGRSAMSLNPNGVDVDLHLMKSQMERSMQGLVSPHTVGMSDHANLAIASRRRGSYGDEASGLILNTLSQLQRATVKK